MIATVLLLLGVIIFLGGITMLSLWTLYVCMVDRQWIYAWGLLATSLICGAATTKLVQILLGVLS